MTPTKGRIVLIHGRPGLPKSLQPEVGLVTKVHPDSTHINVVAFSEQGQMHVHHSIPMVQDDDDPPETGLYAQWMPYQMAVSRGEIAPVVHASPGLGTNAPEAPDGAVSSAAATSEEKTPEEG
jgi:hypothetical protein